MLKILGGEAKGYSLQVPRKDLIRPTSVLLRRKMFDKHQNLNGYTFVDLCAGSGAMGLEAWSRGASYIYLNEPNRFVHSVLMKNIDGLQSRYEVSAGEIKSTSMKSQVWLKQNRERIERKNLILFFDPPYGMHQLYHQFVTELVHWAGAQIWIESDHQKGMPLEYWDGVLSGHSLVTQGSHYIVVAHQ